MNEMLDRRRRLIKYTLKKERESIGSTEDINADSAFKDLVNKKNSVVTRFSSMQLEDLLTSSTKNVAHEVVSCMIPKPGEDGLLLIIESEVSQIKLAETMNRAKSSYPSSMTGSFLNT